MYVDNVKVFAIRHGEQITIHVPAGQHFFRLETGGGLCPNIATSQETTIAPGARQTYRILLPSDGSLRLTRVEGLAAQVKQKLFDGVVISGIDSRQTLRRIPERPTTGVLAFCDAQPQLPLTSSVAVYKLTACAFWPLGVVTLPSFM